MGCGQLTDAGLARLTGAGQLRHLNLRWFELITEAGLTHLAKLTNLRYLNLWNCTQLTRAAVEALRGAVPGCQIDL